MVTNQTMPASLIKILLIRAGIESNPGPITYSCPVCKSNLSRNATSVQCNRCQEWVHFRKSNNCSELPSLKTYNKNYICPACLNDPLPTHFPSNTYTSNSRPPSPPPPPPNTPLPPTIDNDREYDLKILQWNCNGIQNKISELTDFIYQNNIKVVVLQETKLTKNSKTPEIPNFIPIRKDRGKDGGGLAIYIHNSIKHEVCAPIQTDSHIELLAIKIGTTTLTNIYIPPTSSCNTGYMPSLAPFLQLDDDMLLLGDINAHDSLWNSTIFDARGRELAEEINNSNLGVLNDESHTRIPSNSQPTSPDISLASLAILPYAKWETKISLSSDHVPIIISLSTTISPVRTHKRTYVNFKKADWEKFKNNTEAQFENLEEPTNIFEAEKRFRKIVNRVSSRAIPAGRIKDTIPEMPSSTREKMERRDRIRTINPEDPEIAELNRNIYKEITEHRRNKWKETVENIDKSCSSKLFKLLKNLNSKDSSNPYQSIRFKGKYYSTAKGIANKFNKQYSSIVHHKSSKDTRKIINNIKKNTLEDHVSYTPQQVTEAIKKSKNSKAIGPDGLSNLHLKHLGEKGLQYLTHIFNLSIKESKIPDIWKSSVIIPLLKPGKDPCESNSYRPVSLLCPSIKILERLILPTLNEHLNIPDHQHGFRQMHSTVTALNEFNINVTNGFNKIRPPDRTVLLQIDLSKAFDMVSHNKLIADIDNSSMPGAFKRWFTCYLRGRQCRTRFRNSLSKSRNIKTGVPQGAVTSPVLFNFYLSKLPTPPEGIFIVQYADDISIYASGTNIAKLTEQINTYAAEVLDYLKERDLIVSPEKSTVTLFTPDTKEYKIHPKVLLNNQLVPMTNTPKLLGVTFDSMYTFTPHVEQTISKAKSKVNLLKAVAGTDWGQSKELLITTYKAIGRSILEYAVPIWSPIISTTSWKRLQSVQNQALRVATGCLAMAPIEHLHRETKVLPLKEHGEMITNQFTLNCFLPNHPGNRTTNVHCQPRKRKKNILHQITEIQKHLPISDKKDLKKKMNKIHTDYVQKTLSTYPPSKVLNVTPPEINSEETDMSRKSRSYLSQLRSGYSRKLKSYMNRIDDSIPNSCPDCNTSPHDTNHLFNCSSRPTTMSTRNLWTTPKKAAAFLNLEEGIT